MIAPSVRPKIRIILYYLIFALVIYYFPLLFIDLVSRGLVSRLVPLGLLPALILPTAWLMAFLSRSSVKKTALPISAFIALLLFSGFLIFIALSPHDPLTALVLALATPGLIFFLRACK